MRTGWIAAGVSACLTLLIACVHPATQDSGVQPFPCEEDFVLDADEVRAFVAQDGQSRLLWTRFGTSGDAGSSLFTSRGLFDDCRDGWTARVPADKGADLHLAEANSYGESWNVPFIEGFGNGIEPRVYATQLSDGSFEVIDTCSAYGTPAAGMAGEGSFVAQPSGGCSRCGFSNALVVFSDGRASTSACYTIPGAREQAFVSFHPSLPLARSSDAIWELDAGELEWRASAPVGGSIRVTLFHPTEPLLFGDGQLPDDAGVMRRHVFEGEIRDGGVAWGLSPLDEDFRAIRWVRHRAGRYWVLGQGRWSSVPPDTRGAYRLVTYDEQWRSAGRRDFFLPFQLEPFLVFHGLEPWLAFRTPTDGGLRVELQRWSR